MQVCQMKYFKQADRVLGKKLVIGQCQATTVQLKAVQLTWFPAKAGEETPALFGHSLIQMRKE